MAFAWRRRGADRRQRDLCRGRDWFGHCRSHPRARQGDRRFQRIAGTLRRLSTYLSGAQLGITVTSLAIGLVAEPSAAQLLHGPLEAVGLRNEQAEVVAVAIALLVATGVQRVFGELVPKNIALSRPIGTVSWVV